MIDFPLCQRQFGDGKRHIVLLAGMDKPVQPLCLSKGVVSRQMGHDIDQFFVSLAYAFSGGKFCFDRKKAVAVDAAFVGRLKISQSTRQPLPAKPMEPVPMPPKGKDISLSFLRNIA